MLILKNVENSPRKQHMCDLPIITHTMPIWNYVVSPDDAAAFVYTIFTDGEENRHHYAKGALYSALTFLDRTDLRDRGIPIYFAIQDTDYDDLLPYFTLAGVKDEFVVPFTPTAFGILKIMDAFYLPELQRYERLFMVDPDIFARPLKKYPLADKILWDTKKYKIAALDFNFHYDNWDLGLERYHHLKESDASASFPQISDTPSDHLLEKITDTTIAKAYIQAGFVGFSDTFLTQIAEPYRKIADFTQRTYAPNHTFSQYALSEEDLLSICVLEFQLNIYDFNQEIERTFYFVKSSDTDRDTTVINHIHTCIDYSGTKAPDYEYVHWKDQWITDVAHTLQRVS